MLQRHTQLKASTRLFSQVNTLCNKPTNVAGYLVTQAAHQRDHKPSKGAEQTRL
jgi:hypothetical protein